jgi:hypothetical protein
VTSYAFVTGPSSGDKGLGWWGLSNFIPKEELLAAYFTGNGFPTNDRFDYSLFKRGLTAVTPSLSTGYFTAGNASYYEIPLTIDDLMELAPEGFTFLSISKLPTTYNARKCFVGDYMSLSEPSTMLAFHEASGGEYRMYVNPGDGSTSAYSSLPDTAYTGTGFELIAGAVKSNEARVMRRTPAGVANGTAVSLSAPPSGSRPLRIGRAPAGSSFNTAFDHSGLIILKGYKTPTEVTERYEQSQAFYADKMETIEF